VGLGVKAAEVWSFSLTVISTPRYTSMACARTTFPTRRHIPESDSYAKSEPFPLCLFLSEFLHCVLSVIGRIQLLIFSCQR
jgi:hypothetical protein